MIKLFSVEEMVSLEKEANKAGLSYEQMMDNAGRGIADFIDHAYSQTPKKNVISLVGSGNNGGDALVALSYLHDSGHEVYAYIVRKRDNDDPLIKRLASQNGQIIYYELDKSFKKLDELLASCPIIIDGIFGTGIKLPLHGDIPIILKRVKEFIETTPKMVNVIAVDCPSGIDSDTGEASSETIPANITVTMGGVKQGLIKFPAAGLCGKIEVTSIGPIEDLKSYQLNNKYILTSDIVKDYLPKRPINAHKGIFGTALVVAGSINFTGAALLAGKAAYLIGAGLVTMAIAEPLHSAISGQFPEATWIILPDELGVIASEAAPLVKKNMRKASSLLIGPGFGMEDTTKEFLKKLFSEASNNKKDNFGFIGSIEQKSKYSEDIYPPMVIDADGLKLMKQIDGWTKLIPPRTVLTPHPGEMSILTGLSTDEIQNNRIEVAQRYSAQWGHIVVLKGAYTIIAEPTGTIAVVPIATAALAKAGTGDVLAGLIAGLLAQGVSPFNSACAGAWIHAQAGLFALNKIGNSASVVAGDVLNVVPDVINSLI